MYSLEKSKASILLFVFIAISLCLALALVWQARLQMPLLPLEGAAFSPTVMVESDAQAGGRTQAELEDGAEGLAFHFRLNKVIDFPYAFGGLAFGVEPTEDSVDWSAFSSLRLQVACEPRNVLTLVLYTFDEEATRPGDYESLRPSRYPFTCTPEHRVVEVALNRLNTPEWWLNRNGVDYSNKHYDLSRVFSVMIANTIQSPADVYSRVSVTTLALTGWNKSLLYAACGLLFCACLAAGFWWIGRLRRLGRVSVPSMGVAVSNAVAEPQLPSSVSVESGRDKEKAAVLNFMLTAYANPELSLETVVSTLGVNRSKVNLILRDHQGMTFSAYLNKLRLSEAARLLREKDARVAEIACRVGYSSASYFNRVFKKEYGCTPREFKAEQSE